MRIRFYTKPDCSLCREAGNLLRRLGERYPIELEIFLVSDDERMMARCGDRVPLIRIGQHTLDAHTFSPALLERLIADGDGRAARTGAPGGRSSGASSR